MLVTIARQSKMVCKNRFKFVEAYKTVIQIFAEAFDDAWNEDTGTKN